MKVFKKKERDCCGGNYIPDIAKEAETSKTAGGIQILGTGCTKCIALEKITKDALLELKLVIDVDHITDFVKIASYGVMSTPALVINGKVVAYGKVLSMLEMKDILSKEFCNYEKK